MKDSKPNKAILTTSVVSEHISLDQALCFFGMGELMRSCFGQLVLSCGRRPDLISDNNEALWGKLYRGIPIVSPAELGSRSASMAVIITTSQYESVYAQLDELSFSKIYIAEFERSLFRLSVLREVHASDIEDGTVSDSYWQPEKLKDRFALVTGAARGLGFEIARALADAGIGLLLHGRNTESLVNILSYCRDKGVDSMVVAADLADINAVERLGRSIGLDFPQIDILVNNAAISPPADIEVFPYASNELFDLCFKVNALAPIALSNIVLPTMISKGYGKVVNITSSISGKPNAMHYACSKAALDKYVIDLHSSLHGSGVSISSVNPGWLRTPMTGFQGLHDVESAINGVMLPLLLDLNGCWIQAQDFAGMSLQSALKKASNIYYKSEKEA